MTSSPEVKHMISWLKSKKKYLKEPWRLRVHIAYLLLILISIDASPGRNGFIAGSVMMVIGILIRAWASGIVKKDEELAVEGPYSLCRNPLYVGNFLIGYGMCFLNGQWWSFALLTLYFLLIYPFTIRKETRKLSQFFEKEFEQYRKAVPLFFPRLTPYKTLGGWSAQQYFVDNKDFLNEGAVLICWLIVAYRASFPCSWFLVPC